MSNVLVGYAGRPTDKQDMAAQRSALIELGVALNRIYTNFSLSGTNPL